jgi:hypothetical protein
MATVAAATAIAVPRLTFILARAAVAVTARAASVVVIVATAAAAAAAAAATVAAATVVTVAAIVPAAITSTATVASNTSGNAAASGGDSDVFVPELPGFFSLVPDSFVVVQQLDELLRFLAHASAFIILAFIKVEFSQPADFLQLVPAFLYHTLSAVLDEVLQQTESLEH